MFIHNKQWRRVVDALELIEVVLREMNGFPGERPSWNQRNLQESIRELRQSIK